MNTLELNNVEPSDKVAKEIKELNRKLTSVDRLIDPVVQRMAVLNPLWRFVVSSTGFDNHTEPPSLKAVEFKVIEAGEELGTIGRCYHGREHVIEISNLRIGNERTRGGGYRTKDADKAILKAKKMFFKLKPNERIEKAMKSAENVMYQQSRRKEREIHDHRSTIHGAASKFIMGTGFSLFLDHIKSWHEIDSNRINKAMAESNRIGEEMLTIESVKSRFEAGKAALVIKDDGKYLVKMGDVIQLFNDNTLPDDMKGKLGMLKLVEAETFISDMGCRISDEVFVVVMGEG
jgi:hypothetical protein